MAGRQILPGGKRGDPVKAGEQFFNAYGVRLSLRNRLRISVLLLCLEVVLAFSYVGFIQVPPISITTLSIPVIMAAMLFGPADGIAVSLVFAFASMWKASLTSVEEGDIIFSPALSGKPLESVIMALVTRVLFALIAGLLFRKLFSKERKHRGLWIAGISVFSTMVHAALIWLCMELFFSASAVQTGSGFTLTMVLSNAVLYTATVIIALLFDRMMRNPVIQRFFTVTSVEKVEASASQKRFVRILTLVIFAVFALVCLHFVSRVTGYMTQQTDGQDGDFISRVYQLQIQFSLGLASALCILVLFLGWMQEYFNVLTGDARNEAHMRDELIRNNARFFALEDNFESLYDIDLETGDYEEFIKGQTFSDKIHTKFVEHKEFFEDSARNIENVAFPDDREDFKRVVSREYIVKALEKDNHFDYYYRLMVDGAPVWFRLRAVYRDELKNSIIIGVFNASRDVEARQLTENMQLIRGLADGYDALYYTDIEGSRFTVYTLDEQVYPGARKTVDGGKDFWEAIRGYGLSGRLHPDDRHLFEDISPDTVRQRLKDSRKYSLRFRMDTGSGYRWNEMDIFRFEDSDEQANAVAVGFADRDILIRQEQEYQNRLEEARDAAESASRSKTDFLFSMSHDIRTPMNAIMGFTNMAIKHIDNREKAIDCLEKTQKAGGMLLSLINSVLEVSRIESGHAVLEQQPGDIYYSFANIENTMREMADAKDISLSFEFGDIRDRYVIADFGRCMRVFVNIISNAVKYTPDGGFVRVRCEQEGPAKDGTAFYRYTFTDNGIGMSEEFQKHIFEQFSREQTSTVSGIQGSGLGMSVVKSFVDLMGGTVTVRSRQGEGSVFTVILPFGLQEKTEYIDPSTGEVLTSANGFRSAPKRDFTGHSVLLVEDNEMNREIAVDLLQEEGLRVESADDGTAAVETVKRRGPDFYDFILMDIQMPKMNGYEATKAIRALYPDKHIPIIALSANAFAEDKAKSAEAGMDDHVAKPINVRELFAVLAKYL
ncbi:MAG: hypothetical protein CW338_08930 [Clostridiales bacterium]|nr:hypothetical protein [Clostridiales bacterium]